MHVIGDNTPGHIGKGVTWFVFTALGDDNRNSFSIEKKMFQCSLWSRIQRFFSLDLKYRTI